MVGNQGGTMSFARTVSVSVSAGSHAGVWTVTFESEAVPGTLAVFAGTLALARLDIVSAMVRAGNGTVTDVFGVAPLDDAAVTPEDGETLAIIATEALNGRRDLAVALRALRRVLPPASGPSPRVEIHTDSTLTTGVRVVAPDRVGLLHDIAATLTAHRFRTRSLSALSFSGAAHDTFRIVDADGRPPTELSTLDRLQKALVVACS